MNLAALSSRRAAIIAPLLAALGRSEQAEADTCTKKCKKKNKKDQRKRCLKACKKKKQGNQSQPQAVQFSGTGSQVTAPFYMIAGRYIATASISATQTTNFIIWLHGPGQYYTADLVVNEIPEAPGSYQYQSVVQVEDTGSHFLEVKYAGGSWTVLFSPS